MKPINKTRWVLFLIITLPLALSLGSCQKELKAYRQNPEQYTPSANVVVPGMFTDMLNEWMFYVKDYGNWWWELTNGMGIVGYAQIGQWYLSSNNWTWFADYNNIVSGTSNGDGFNEDNSFGHFFEQYYVRLKNWGLIKQQLAGMSGQQLLDNQVYFQLASIEKDWAAIRNVDMWNSIPYFNAFKGIQNLSPGYDDPQQIYDSVLVDLQNIGENLPAMYSKMSSGAQQLLQTQDIAFHGNIEEWVEYTNALRLRYAVVISGVQPDFAKQQIADVLTKKLPQTDLYWAPTENEQNSMPQGDGGGVWERGLYENSYATFIPDIIMYRMNFDSSIYQPTVDDPRLPVIAMPSEYGDYRGVSYNSDANNASYQADIAPGNSYPMALDWGTTQSILTPLTSNGLSEYNWCTYTFNQFPQIAFTRAQVDLLLAEVELKGLGNTGETAGDHIRDAVINSTNFWYTVNAMDNWSRSADTTTRFVDGVTVHPRCYPDKPSDAIIANYANKVETQFNAAASLDDKMEILMEQKYIHLNIMDPWILWTDLRRTRHPKLEPFTFNGQVMTPEPERLKYPVSEQENNQQNFLKVVSQNNYTSPIFWIPQSLQNVSYYGTGYISLH